MTPQEIDTALAEIGKPLEERGWRKTETIGLHPCYDRSGWIREVTEQDAKRMQSVEDQPTLLAIIKQLRATDNNEH